MKIKESKGEKIFNIVNLLLVTAIALVMLYPLWHIIMASLSSGDELMRHRGLLLLPRGFEIGAYISVFDNPMILKGFQNTFIVLVTAVLLNLVFTILMAYVLSRKEVMWQKAILLMAITTMYFSGGMIPRYIIISKVLHINDTLLALILPTLINTYNLIILKTSFSSVPRSLEESAQLDGASHLTILFRIIVPLSMPVISVMVLYYAVQHWNSWFDASIFLRTREKFPLQLVLKEILIQNNTSSMTMNAGDSGDQALLSETVKYAVICVATIPILCIYPFLQKYFVKGVMIGAVKG